MTSVCYKCGMWLKKHVPFLSFNRALVGGADQTRPTYPLHLEALRRGMKFSGVLHKHCS